MFPWTGASEFALKDQAVIIESYRFRQSTWFILDISFEVFVSRWFQDNLMSNFFSKNEIESCKYGDIKLIKITFERRSATGRR